MTVSGSEDADVMDSSVWSSYNPATAVIERSETPTGKPLPHLRDFPHIPSPQAERVFERGSVRVQALCDRILRVEFSADGKFEDRASFTFPLRGANEENTGAIEAQFNEESAVLSVSTPLCRVEVKTNAECFTGELVSAAARTGADRSMHVYTPSDAVTSAKGLLPGTCRTLDGCDGYVHRSWSTHEASRVVDLQSSVLARTPVVFVDDSQRGLFTENGWFTCRRFPTGSKLYRDVYIVVSNPDVGAGEHAPLDYRATLKAFSRLSGQTPLLPRRFLGNWWSRYYAYTEKSLGDVVKGFEEREAPLSVVIIDMDWHVVDVKHISGNNCNGWTGYTWNKELFPDPARFLKWLHDRQLSTALNLHPADGVWRHEGQYKAYAHFLGASEMAKTGKPIPFDLSDELSAAAYFKVLLHPHEEMGDYTRSFWWIDWQQGAKSRLKGIDPLFLLNHLHFIDLGRDDGKRPAVFSRFAGLGSHRYPIGFSGDTWATWESLAFQVYMTSSSSNANYHWWSHDIGGHTRDIPNNGELYARWVQFGVLSPIMRLHSSNNPFIFRNPWAYKEDIANAAVHAMRLRHRLVPYLFSMAYRAHSDAIPLVMPMYYTHAGEDAAFAVPAQYWFGSELIVAPFVSPINKTTNMARQTVWLPADMDGVKFDAPWRQLQTGEAMEAGAFHAIYGTIDCIPIFAKPGAIIPMADTPTGTGGKLNSVQNPEKMCITVVAGGDGSFKIFEDEETGKLRKFMTPISVDWSSDKCKVVVGPPANADGVSVTDLRDIEGVVPTERAWEITLLGVSTAATVCRTLAGGGKEQISAEFNESRESMTFCIGKTSTLDEMVFEITATGHLLSVRDRRAEKVRSMLQIFAIGREVVWHLSGRVDQLIENIKLLRDVNKNDVAIDDRMRTFWTMSADMKRAIYETVVGSGCARAFLS
eukprot:IDg10177t1